MTKKKHAHIVDAALTYTNLQRPSLAARSGFAELIAGHLERLTTADQKKICNLLAPCEHVSLTLLKRLCQLESAICHPLLVGAKAFDDEILYSILNENSDLKKARIIARNPSIGPQTIALLRTLVDPKVDQSMDLRQQALATGNRKQGVKTTDLEVERSEVDTLALSLADENDAVVHTALSDALGLSLSSIAVLSSDPTSRNLPIALRFLKLDTDEAWRVYARLTQNSQPSRKIEDAFRSVYENLKPSECKMVIGQWQMDELVDIVRTNRVANDTFSYRTLKTG